jgi:hypothetical protein
MHQQSPKSGRRRSSTPLKVRDLTKMRSSFLEKQKSGQINTRSSK